MKVVALDKFDWKHPGLGENAEAGGAKKFLHKHLSRLSDKGHDINLISAKHPDLKSRENIDGVDVMRTGLPHSKNLLFIYTLGQLIINYYIKKIQPDIILSVHSPLPWIILDDTPVVSVFHHVNDKESLRQRNGFVGSILYKWELWGVKRAIGQQIIAVSNDTRDDLMDFGHQQKNIKVVRNGVDSKKFTPGDKFEAPTVLYLGRLDERKGVDKIPSIYDNLVNRELDFDLHIAGDGEKKKYLRNFSKDKYNIRFHGFVSESKKVDLLTKSWLVILPSRKEGYGIVVLEANASGTPVVANNVRGLKESVKDSKTGFLEDLENTEEFCDRIQEILTEKELRKRLSKNCREFAQKHSWDEASSRLEDTLMSET
ncbi:MAG: glycosyltransferase [Candidatus Nanosalina sp. J07AB43]|nr:MAG: glycosyltransferase [Candidatus Nanosalina sp. J07AB43]